MLHLDRHQVGTTPGNLANLDGFATDRRLGIHLSNPDWLCESLYSGPGRPKAVNAVWAVVNREPVPQSHHGAGGGGSHINRIRDCVSPRRRRCQTIQIETGQRTSLGFDARRLHLVNGDWRFVMREGFER